MTRTHNSPLISRLLPVSGKAGDPQLNKFWILRQRSWRLLVAPGIRTTMPPAKRCKSSLQRRLCTAAMPTRPSRESPKVSTRGGYRFVILSDRCPYMKRSYRHQQPHAKVGELQTRRMPIASRSPNLYGKENFLAADIQKRQLASCSSLRRRIRYPSRSSRPTA